MSAGAGVVIIVILLVIAGGIYYYLEYFLPGSGCLSASSLPSPNATSSSTAAPCVGTTGSAGPP